MRKVFLPLFLLALTPLRAADKPAKPKRAARVIVVKPYFDPKLEAANLAGGIIGNLIGQWMMRKRGPDGWQNWESDMSQGLPEEPEFVPLYRAPVTPPILTLTVESNPPGSEVLVDWKPLGVTPIRVDLPSGTRYVVVRREGYQPFTSRGPATWNRNQAMRSQLMQN